MNIELDEITAQDIPDAALEQAAGSEQRWNVCWTGAARSRSCF
ncbi:hypothetical protein [Zwartia hollandica]|jgi:hypothetical protein|nr:hypothetical protein [Zwartia hollandica]